MLTKALAIADYDKGRVLPDRLERSRHAHYLAYAERMLEIYGAGIGRTRQQLHEAIRALFRKSLIVRFGAWTLLASSWTM